MTVYTFTGNCVNTATPPLVEFVDGTDPDHSWVLALGAETRAGWKLKGEYSTNAFASIAHTITRTLVSADLTGTSFNFSGGDVPANGNYSVRFYIEDKAGRISDYSLTEDISLVWGTDSTAPVLTSAAGTTTGSTTATGSVSTNEGNGTMYAVVTTSATTPSKAQVKAGQNHAGAAATFADDVTVDAIGTWAFAATGLTANTAYYWHFMHEDAATNQATVVSSTSFTTDATTATLTSPTDAKFGQTEATISVSTNTGSGTLYAVIVTDTSVPSRAQVKNGKNSAGSAAAWSSSQPIDSTGVKSFTPTGLLPDTQYYTHFMQDTGSWSPVSSADGFRTGMADSLLSEADGGDQEHIATTATFDFATAINVGAADSRRRISIIVTTNGGTAATHSSLKLYTSTANRAADSGGTSLTQRASTGATADTASTNYKSIWDADLATGTTYYARLVSSAAANRAHMEVYIHSRPFSGNAVIEDGAGSNTTLSGSINIPSRGAVIGAASWTATDIIKTATWEGITEAWDAQASSALYTSGGLYQNTGGAETGRTIRITLTDTTSNIRLVAAAYGESA